ncbi:transcriptional regulator [Pleurocapsa sp. PCC 7327]|uniref:TetR family transcriptional regulator n=1 Tax=Pleurocapsa sp. PCC 7327 TaxID=118163 RepID=UPI00029FA5EC|nr:TetR family transcriptional regulator [Pleurocapsa sp. PCC 7327]AFY79423.1 transcriptional regulator [Pleurocapsa sp. PCC 7327]
MQKGFPATSRDEILAAAKRLAAERPLDKINLTDVAKEAGVSWPTVRRYVGNKKQLRELLATEQTSSSPQLLDTRSRILASASRIFAQHGYAGATLDAIAADAGLTKGAVYWHFPSKSDLFLALMEQRMQSRLPALPEEIDRAFSSEDREAGIAELLASQLGYAQANPDWVRLYLEFITESREPEVQKLLGSTTYKNSQEMVNSSIRRLQDNGQIAADIDPFVLATFWAGMLDGLILAWIANPQRVNPQSWSNQLARILWRGIQPLGDR